MAEDVFMVHGREIKLYPPRNEYEQGRHQCPGDGDRGCSVVIPDARLRCYFCTKTVRLSRGVVIP